MSASKRLPQFVDEFDRDGREIVDEIERVLDLVRDAGGQLPKRGELLGLDQAVLRGPQILQRLRQFARARFFRFEQPHILDCDRRLVGEGRYQLDLLIGERVNLTARKRDDTDRLALAQQRNANHRAKPPISSCFFSYIVVGPDVVNSNNRALKQCSP